MKHFVALLLFAVVAAAVVSTPRTALACSCIAGVAPEQQFQMSSAVFAGRVTSVDDAGGTFGAPYRRVSFQVSESWKGVSSDSVTVTTGIGGGDCGFNFEPDKDYLVYAHEGSLYGSNSLEAGICSRTALLSEAKEDLRSLGVGTSTLADAKMGIPAYAFLPLPILALIALSYWIAKRREH